MRSWPRQDAYEFGPDDITAAGHDVVETLRKLCFVQTVEPHLRLQRAQLTGLDDYGATRSDCRGKFDARNRAFAFQGVIRPATPTGS